MAGFMALVCGSWIGIGGQKGYHQASAIRLHLPFKATLPSLGVIHFTSHWNRRGRRKIVILPRQDSLHLLLLQKAHQFQPGSKARESKRPIGKTIILL